jgi:hypothetical protein
MEQCLGEKWPTVYAKERLDINALRPITNFHEAQTASRVPSPRPNSPRSVPQGTYGGRPIEALGDGETF